MNRLPQLLAKCNPQYKSFIVESCKNCGSGGTCKRGYLYHPRAFMKAKSPEDIRRKFVNDALFVLKNNGRRPENVTYDDYNDILFYFTRHIGPGVTINKIEQHVSPYAVVLREFIKCVFDWDDQVLKMEESSAEYNISGNIAGVQVWINMDILEAVAEHYIGAYDHYVELVE